MGRYTERSSLIENISQLNAVAMRGPVYNRQMDKKLEYKIEVGVKTAYLEAQSNPAGQRYVFAYTINMENVGDVAAKLLSRHWLITHGDGKVEEVFGEGVVGQNPYLKPGQAYRYTSGAVLTTPVGSMQGSYQMIADDGARFETEVPLFLLSAPGSLN